jgi:hypothetical protein
MSNTSVFFKDLTEEQLAVALRPTFDEFYDLLTPVKREELDFNQLVASSYDLLHGGEIDLSSLEAELSRFDTSDVALSDCQKAVLPVVVDGITIFSILSGMVVSVGQVVGRAVAAMLGLSPAALNGIQVVLQGYTTATTTFQKAKYIGLAVGQMLRAIGARGLIQAISSSMSWKDWIVLVVTMVAQLVAWAATDGLVVIAELALLVTYIAVFSEHVADMVKVCGTRHPNDRKAILEESSQTPPAICQFDKLVYIVWAGKSDKKINILSSSDEKKFDDKHKITLKYTTTAAPSITSFKGNLYIAWVAKDTHSITTISTSDGRQFTEPLYLPYNSEITPAIGTFDGKLVVAWVDKSSKSIKVISSANGKDFSNPMTIDGKSNQAPSITSAWGYLFIAWVTSDKNNPINLIQSSNGVDFYKKRSYSIAPDPVGFSLSNDGQNLWFIWQNKNNEIFYMRGDWIGPGVLKEKAHGNPVIDYPYIAWTGTDMKHRLNVSTI